MLTHLKANSDLKKCFSSAIEIHAGRSEETLERVLEQYSETETDEKKALQVAKRNQFIHIFRC
jgi:hypothetical protein